MTLATTTSREQYATNGQTTVWPVPFAFHGAEDLVVVLSDNDGGNPQMLVGQTDYLVEGGEGETGALVCPPLGAAHPAGKLLTVTRELSLLQDLDLVNLDGFDAELVERQFDRSRMIDQQLQEQIDRCVKSPVTDPDGLSFADIQAERTAAAAHAASASSAAVAAANASATALAAQGAAESARDEARTYRDEINPALLAPADHLHTGIYEPADPDILKADVSKQLQVSFPVKAGDGAGNNETMPSGNFTVDWRAPDQRNFTLTGNATLYDETGQNGNERAVYEIVPNGYTLALNGTKFKKVLASGDWSTSAMNIVSLLRNGIDGITSVFITQRGA